MKPKKRLKYIATYWAELEKLDKKIRQTQSGILKGVLLLRRVVISVKIEQFLKNKIGSNF